MSIGIEYTEDPDWFGQAIVVDLLIGRLIFTW